MMHKIGVISQWDMVGLVPEINVMTLYRGLANMTDAAGTPAVELIPLQNIACIDCIVDDTVLALMQSDPQVLAIIYQEDIDQ